MGSRQWVGQKAPEAIICLPAKNSTVCPLFAYSLPTVCLVCTYCVRSLCLLCTFFLPSVWNKEEGIQPVSSQEPFIHYPLCSAPCCRKTRADVSIKYLPTNQFVFRLFSLLFFEEKNSKSCSNHVNAVQRDYAVFQTADIWVSFCRARILAV